MIKNILELLKLAKGETNNIEIAQGKYALPENLKQAFEEFKKITNANN